MKIIKNNFKLFIGILIGGILFGGLGIAFASTFLAKDVTYKPEDNSFNVNNVGAALDKLYEMDRILETISNSECISGSFICGTDCVGSKGQSIENEFEPILFVVYFIDQSTSGVHFYNPEYSTEKAVTYAAGAKFGTTNYTNLYKIENGGLYAHDFGSGNNGKKWYYTACK